MPEELLADYFLNTLFPYYTTRFMGVDPHLDYSQDPAMGQFSENWSRWLERFCAPGGKRMLAPPTPKGDFKPFLAYKEAVETAIRSFQGNPRLITLGIAYMRQKVMTEKIQEAMKELSGDPAEAAQKQLLATDRLTQDLQSMIFAWMKDGYLEFLARYRAASQEQKALAGASLADYAPAFLSEPYDAAIMADLPEYTRPASKVNGLTLPVYKVK
jgi:hypothetical protein